MEQVEQSGRLTDRRSFLLRGAAVGAGAIGASRLLTAPLHLELVEATTYATGVAIHVYRPGTSAADQPVDPDER